MSKPSWPSSWGSRSELPGAVAAGGLKSRSVPHAAAPHLERWVSGLYQDIANVPYVSKRTAGSNPALSATSSVDPNPWYKPGVRCFNGPGTRESAPGELPVTVAWAARPCPNMGGPPMPRFDAPSLSPLPPSPPTTPRIKNRKCGPAPRRVMRRHGSAMSSVTQRWRWAAIAVILNVVAEGDHARDGQAIPHQFPTGMHQVVQVGANR